MPNDAQTISLSPAIVHFENLVQGDTLAFQISLTDGDGNPIDISADQFDMEIRRADGSLVIALGLGNGLEITGPGVLYGQVEPVTTAALDPDYTYNYDVQWTTGTYVRTISWGTIKPLKQITTA